MNQRIVYTVFALISTLLFFLAVGYNGWGCGGSILGNNCLKLSTNNTTGALLLTAGFCLLLASIFLILTFFVGITWPGIVSTVFAALGAILSMAGVFYYYANHPLWSPFIAVIAMTLSIGLTTLLLFDLVKNKVK